MPLQTFLLWVRLLVIGCKDSENASRQLLKTTKPFSTKIQVDLAKQIKAAKKVHPPKYKISVIYGTATDFYRLTPVSKPVNKRLVKLFLILQISPIFHSNMGHTYSCRTFLSKISTSQTCTMNGSHLFMSNFLSKISNNIIVVKP